MCHDFYSINCSLKSMEVGVVGAAGHPAQKPVTRAPRPETGDATTLTPCMEGPRVAVHHDSLKIVIRTTVQVSIPIV
jgi:hypothetical protein